MATAGNWAGGFACRRIFDPGFLSCTALLIATSCATTAPVPSPDLSSGTLYCAGIALWELPDYPLRLAVPSGAIVTAGGADASGAVDVTLKTLGTPDEIVAFYKCALPYIGNGMWPRSPTKSKASPVREQAAHGAKYAYALMRSHFPTMAGIRISGSLKHPDPPLHSGPANAIMIRLTPPSCGVICNDAGEPSAPLKPTTGRSSPYLASRSGSSPLLSAHRRKAWA